MRILITILLTSVLSFSFIACGGKSGTPMQSPSQEQVSDSITAGDDQNVLIGEEVTIQASTLVSDKTFSTYSWSENGKVLGTNETLKIKNLSEGKHTIILTAKDTLGALYHDSISVTIKKPDSINTPPKAKSFNISIDEDNPIQSALKGEDSDGDALHYLLVKYPSHGHLSGSLARLVYTPNPDYNGNDSFTYKINDGTIDSNLATVSIMIRAINDIPTAKSQTIYLDENSAKTITLSGNDVENSPLTFSYTNPKHGTFDGTTYTPYQYYDGNDAFTFTSNDGTADSKPATITIVIANKFTSINTTPFILTYNTQQSKTIKIPLKSSKHFFKIDWGDTHIDTYHDDTNITTHTYTDTNPTHQVKIYGINSISHWNQPMSPEDKNQLLSIDQWGDTKWTSMHTAFSQCHNLVLNATDKPDLSEVENMNNMFEATNINSDINDWDVSNVTSMQFMFHNAKKFNQPLNNWDVSNVTNMQYMFYYATNFNQDISAWDVSGVNGAYTMEAMMMDTNLSIANYDKLLNQWSKLTFKGSIQFTTNIKPQTQYNAYEAHNLLSSKGWEFTDGGLTQTTKDEISFITTWETNSTHKSITIPIDNTLSYNYTVDWGDGHTETSTESLTHTFGTDGNHTIKIYGLFPRPFFQMQSQLRSINHWGAQRWQSMNSAFKGCIHMTSNFDDKPNLEDVRDMSYMFASSIAGSTPTIFNQDISDWNVSKVTNMSMMFYFNKKFNQALAAWDVSKVTDMNHMFYAAENFNGNISPWDTSSVTDMENMFNYATNFNQNLAHWNISSVSNTMGLFFSDSNLSDENYTLTLAGWLQHHVQKGISLEAGDKKVTDKTPWTTLKNQYNWHIVDSTPLQFHIGNVWDRALEEKKIHTLSTPTRIGDAPMGNLVWSLSGDTGRFSIDSSSGIITMDPTAITLDNDSANDRYHLTIKALDDKKPENFDEKNITITLATVLPYLTINHLSTDYNRSVEGVVYHKTTGLYWDDSSSMTKRKFTEATAYCQNLTLDDYQDWRLPTLVELQSLMDHNTSNNSYLNEIFRHDLSDYRSDMWTTSIRDHSSHWSISFSAGAKWNANGGDLYSICVRGTGRIRSPKLQRDDALNIVSDDSTNLIWQDTIDNKYKMLTWNEAMNYCQNLSLAGYTWRVPTINELLSITPVYENQPNYSQDYQLPNPFQFFINEPVWSSTKHLGSNTTAFTIDFYNYGRHLSYDSAMTRSHNVRCVTQ